MKLTFPRCFQNVELVAKLLAHGKALLEHSEQGEAETSWAMVSEPDEQAVAMQEGDRMTEFGIQSAWDSFV